MADPTTLVTDIAQHLQDMIEENKDNLRVKAVYYGDQDKIAFTPTVCVESGGKTRELNGAPRRTMVNMENYILVYVGAVMSSQTNRLDDDTVAEAIEALVHTDAQMEGRVIDSMVTAVEFGYLQRNNSLFRTARLTVTARQQEQLPSSF